MNLKLLIIIIGQFLFCVGLVMIDKGKPHGLTIHHGLSLIFLGGLSIWFALK